MIPHKAAVGIFCAGAGSPTGSGFGGDAAYTASALGEARPAPSAQSGTQTGSGGLGYLAGTDPKDPLVAPVNPPEMLAKFPPTLIITATRGFEMSGAIYTHGQLVKSGVEADLHVWDGLFHGFFYNSAVTGIATTVMSTFDVIKHAAASGKNMVITHEPTFWTGNDDVRNFGNDPIYQKKLQFIRDNKMVIWRFHDHLHARQPDMSATGLAEALGWNKSRSKDEPSVYVLPPVKLRDLAKDVEKRLKLQALRVIGDPEARVSRAALLQGTPPFHAATVLTKVDVVVAGEQREWEGVEYTADANTAGERKGMILIGHWVSEDQGMRVCADWLKTFISEVPIQWIPAGDPFWRP